MSAVDSNSLLLKQLATGKQDPSLLAGQGLDMDWPEQADTHHLRNTARIIAVALVHLNESVAHEVHAA